MYRNLITGLIIFITLVSCGTTVVKNGGGPKITAIDISNQLNSFTNVNLKLNLIQNLTGHTQYVFYIDFSKDMKYLASGSADKTVIIRKVSDWSVVKTLTESYDQTWGIPLKFTPDNKYLIIGSYEDLVIFSVNDNFQQEASILANKRGIQSIAVTPDSKYVITAGSDGKIYIWSIPSLDFVNTFVAHSSEVWSIDISPDGKYLISGGEDRYLKLWSFPDCGYISGVQYHLKPIEYVKFSHNGDYILSSSSDGTTSIWYTGDLSSPLRVLSGSSGSVLAADFSVDDRFIIAGSEDYNVYVFDLKDGKIINTAKDHYGDVMAVTASPDGRYIATGSRDRTIKIWSLK